MGKPSAARGGQGRRPSVGSVRTDPLHIHAPASPLLAPRSLRPAHTARESRELGALSPEWGPHSRSGVGAAPSLESSLSPALTALKGCSS